MAGRVHIKLCRAKDLKSQDWMSKNDPFCVLSLADAAMPSISTIEAQKDNPSGCGAWRSKIVDNGGTACSWSETTSFEYSHGQALRVVCWDDDGGDAADCIGVAIISLASLLKNPSGKRDWYVLKGMGKGTPHGFVELEIMYQPAPAAAPVARAAPPAAAHPPGFHPGAAAAPPPGFPAGAAAAGGPPPGFGGVAAGGIVAASVPIADCVIIE